MSIKRIIFTAAALLAMAGCSTIGQAPSPSTPADLSKIAGWKGAAPRSAEAFNFVILSDRTGGHAEGKWAAAVRQVNLLQPDFVVCVGDLIEGYTEDTAKLAEQWDEFERLTSSLDAPFFYCAGNHDFTNQVMDEIYIERHGVDGKSYYSFDYRDCHFVVMNYSPATRNHPVVEEELAWLADDLAAAKGAEHVFVFYHEPMWPNGELWARLRDLLPAGKTTIFNGHWHRLDFDLTHDIPTYVLSSTAVKITPKDRSGDQFNMFAHVSVDRGKPTIALIPLDEVLPGQYAEFVSGVNKLRRAAIYPKSISARGGEFTISQTNPLKGPVKVSVSWKADGWQISPATAEFEVAPQATVQQTFSLAPVSPTPPAPAVQIIYELPGISFDRSMTADPIPLRLAREIDVASATDIVVDGDLGEWAAIEPLPLTGADRILEGPEFWAGPPDASAAIRAATDGKRFFLAVDVTDDQIATDPQKPWLADSVHFFWDTRPPEQSKGRFGKGAGHAALNVPATGAEPTCRWLMPDGSSLKGLALSFKRREGGYVYELSIPLSELGVTAAPEQGLMIEIQLNDLDVTEGQASMTRMAAGSDERPGRKTEGYLRCRFK